MFFHANNLYTDSKSRKNKEAITYENHKGYINQ